MPRLADPPVQGLLSYRGAAEYLGMSRRWLEKRVGAGDIPVVKMPPGGTSVRFRVEDLDAFAAAHLDRKGASA